MIVCFHLALLIWNPPPDRLDPLTPQEQRDSVPKHVRDSPHFQQNPRETPRFSQDLCDAAKRNDVDEIARLIQSGRALPNAMELKQPSFHRPRQKRAHAAQKPSMAQPSLKRRRT